MIIELNEVQLQQLAAAMNLARASIDALGLNIQQQVQAAQQPPQPEPPAV
jgi:hypothetical protein